MIIIILIFNIYIAQINIQEDMIKFIAIFTSHRSPLSERLEQAMIKYA